MYRSIFSTDIGQNVILTEMRSVIFSVLEHGRGDIFEIWPLQQLGHATRTLQSFWTEKLSHLGKSCAPASDFTGFWPFFRPPRTKTAFTSAQVVQFGWFLVHSLLRPSRSDGTPLAEKLVLAILDPLAHPVLKGDSGICRGLQFFSNFFWW